LVLPGVGSFDTGMRNLINRNLIEPLNKSVLDDKKPILGICLGMQLLSNNSEEGPKIDGLGYIPGNVIKLNNDRLRIPHIGFNEANSFNENYFSDVLNNNFYFVHSYHYVPKDKNHIISTTNYGKEFVSGVQKNNIIGTQFHPEKSQSYGLVFLKEFMNFSRNNI
jgi:glutamine amidotransferase